MSERDPSAILRDRTQTLEGELRALEEKRREAASLSDRATQLGRELDASRALLAGLGQGKKRTALPLLEDIQIASPCSARWDEMSGDAKIRFCGQCEKSVYDLSAMTREEAETTLLGGMGPNGSGEMCVRLYRRTDGKVLTQDCPVGVRRKRMRLAAVLLVGSGLATMAVAFLGFGTELEENETAPEPPPPVPYVMTVTPPPTVVPVIPPTRHFQGAARPFIPADVDKPAKPQSKPSQVQKKVDPLSDANETPR